MFPPILIILAGAVLAFLFIRLLIVELQVFGHLNNVFHSKKGAQLRTMIVAGSGGHTTEILRLTGSIGKQYSPRLYIVASSDAMSPEKIKISELNSEDFSIHTIPRSREVLQSYLTSVLTTLQSAAYCFPLVAWHRPDLAGPDVAEHYNRVPESSIVSRADCRAFYLRNFNNWVKSVLIGTHLRLVKDRFSSKQGEDSAGIRVLDLCSGKGGDLLKWRKGDVSEVVFVDIADVSVDQCRRRYGEMVEQHRDGGHRGRRLLKAEFHVADATAVRLRDLQASWPQFHLVSCQFSLHYCFQSYQAARQFVRNASESLLPGGYFVGTIPDANEIVRRLRRQPGNEASFGNNVYNVTFSSAAVKTQQVPLFGCKYHFTLENQVRDCPEYLVYFPVLEQLCSEYGLRCTLRLNFADFYRRHVTEKEWRQLLGTMQSLEPYPCSEGVELKSSVEGDYRAAEAFLSGEGGCDEELGDDEARDRSGPIGTLSGEEWEAATLYMVFAFQRQ